jgi:hypothetical protein
MTLHKITEFYTEWFSVYHNITSKVRTVATFKNCIKQNNDSNKAYRFVHDLFSKVNLFECDGSWVVSTKQTMNYDIKTAAMFVFFVSDKNGRIKSCSLFEDLLVYKISWSHIHWCKFCIHLRIWTSAILECLKVRD